MTPTRPPWDWTDDPSAPCVLCVEEWLDDPCPVDDEIAIPIVAGEPARRLCVHEHPECVAQTWPDDPPRRHVRGGVAGELAHEVISLAIWAGGIAAIVGLAGEAARWADTGAAPHVATVAAGLIVAIACGLRAERHLAVARARRGRR